MVKNFWEGAGGDLSKKWAELLFGPAFLFWLVTILLVTRPIGWDKVWDWLTAGDGFQQAARLVAGLLLVSFSEYLVSRADFVVLRGLEGYWPSFLDTIAQWMIDFRKKRNDRLESEWQLLRGKKRRKETLTRPERRKLATLEMKLHYVPPAESQIMPTTLGNIIRTGEAMSEAKYGLDPMVCWARLWLVLPDAARTEISGVRSALNRLVSWWSWGLLSLVWVYWLPWLAVISGVWLWLAYRLMLPVARNYADLIEAAFDLFRWELYTHLHLPLPATSADEAQSGKDVTELLWRGPVGDSITYVHPGKS